MSEERIQIEGKLLEKLHALRPSELLELQERFRDDAWIILRKEEYEEAMSYVEQLKASLSHQHVLTLWKAAEPCVDGVMLSIWRCDCGHLFTEPARGALSELALQTSGDGDA